MPRTNHILRRKPMTVPLTVRVAEALKKAVEEAAAESNRPMNRFVAAILAAHLRRPELAEVPLGKAGRPKRMAKAS
jgi:hypothetical protein